MIPRYACCADRFKNLESAHERCAVRPCSAEAWLEGHAELAQWAEREGVSLNQFITKALQSRIGWGTDGEEDGAPTASSGSPVDERTRLIAIALVANAIVIGLAAAAAIGVLVLAWRG